jgi:periplasmic protein TonB
MSFRNSKKTPIGIIKALLVRIVSCGGAAMITLALFLVLPLMQTISKPPVADLTIQTIDTAELDAPPPPPEEEPEEEPEPEETPPELTEEAPPMTLEQLTVALNPGMGDGWMQGDFAMKIDNAVKKGNDIDALFSVADLDQKPRIIYQPGPVLTQQLRQRAPGTVYVIFIVNQQGRVENPVIQKSSDPIFEEAALKAIKKWKFEPGKRNGKPVRFRMRVPFTFPKGN